jgi:RNA polymerase sigma-70 factor (ECF subfamily)
MGDDRIGGPEMTDQQVLARARRGDNAARQELVMRHGGRLQGLARGLVGGHDADAQDVVQETFLAAFDGLNRFRGDSGLWTWLSGILVNRVRKLRRYRLPRRAESLDESARSVTASVGDGCSPATHVQRRLDVRAMLDSLSAEHREVVVLREMHGMTYAEMGQALGIPERTAETRLTRARRALRERFAGYLE